MQHLKKTRKFGRERNQRNALLKSLIRSLIEQEKIVTTEAKAKSLRPLVEKVITRGKSNNLAAVRYLNSFLDAKNAKKVYEVLGPRYQSRAGGYTRILRRPARKSDGSPQALIEFVK